MRVRLRPATNVFRGRQSAKTVPQPFVTTLERKSRSGKEQKPPEPTGLRREIYITAREFPNSDAWMGREEKVLTRQLLGKEQTENRTES